MTTGTGLPQARHVHGSERVTARACYTAENPFRAPAARAVAGMVSHGAGRIAATAAVAVAATAVAANAAYAVERAW